MRILRLIIPAMLCLSVSGLAFANPIELTPGLWQIDSKETQEMTREGRIGTRAPIETSEQVCLNEETAWLIPSDFANSFNSRGCRQLSMSTTLLDFKGQWSCFVDGLNMTITMEGDASLEGTSYSTLMTLQGKNAQTSVDVQNSVTARYVGLCPGGTTQAPVTTSRTVSPR